MLYGVNVKSSKYCNGADEIAATNEQFQLDMCNLYSVGCKHRQVNHELKPGAAKRCHGNWSSECTGTSSCTKTSACQ
jgi:hypothetical protein